MGHRRSATYWFNLFGAAGLVLAALAGCSGDDGAPGPAGSNAAWGGSTTTVSAYASTTTGLTLTITGVTVASPPVVNFSVKDQDGKPVTGLLPENLRFTVAKLMEGSASNGNLDSWQSYVLRARSGRIQAERETPTVANLVDNEDGTYQYTFATDITSATCPATPCNDSYGNAIDLSYNASLTHRVGIQIRRGTSSLPLANTTYTFRPSDGATTGITLRDIVKTANCNGCHGTLEAHDQRTETKYCVTCHNPGTTANGQTGTVTGDTPVDFKVMIHKIHNAEELPSVLGPDGILNTADDGDYGVIGFSGTLTSFKEVKFPQLITNCTKCHDGAASDTPQGDNWKNRPSRAACGSCHDNVNFATGANHPAPGGIQNDDRLCAACHTADAIATKHLPVEMTNSTPGSEAGRAAFQDNLPAGAKKVEYQIESVTVSGTNATVKFRILMDGAPVTFNAAGSPEMLNNFTGGPRFYVAYAVPMDGITAPADFNYSAYVLLTDVWSGAQGTLSGPDGSGYYTAVLIGSNSNATTQLAGRNVNIPAAAKMVTVVMAYAFTQKDLPDYPGGLTLTTPLVKKVATGYTARRVIVAKDNCDNCHAQLGIGASFHGGDRNDPTICNICHYPQRTSNGWSGRSNSFIHAIHGASERSVNFTWHGTQAAAPVLIDTGYWQIAYPGILKNCETCHVSGGYDFSGSAYTEALVNSIPYSYVATGTMSATSFTRSPYVDSTGTFVYGSNFSYAAPAAAGSSDVTTTADNTTLVTSPISTACFSCHDSSPAKAHMESNGGYVYATRGSGASLPNSEACLVCHGPGKLAAIAEVHAR
jgi:OmcA/MtrC family decaheme c-type cytochrome